MDRDLPKISFHGATDTGNVRCENEDTFHICEAGSYGLIADGMGGAAAGEVASKIFAETAKKVFNGRMQWAEKETLLLVQKTFSLANKEILSHVKHYPQDHGMGCTAELFALCREGFIIGHVGDSRTYRVRNGRLKQLTKDHSLVQDLVDNGVITLEEARQHAKRNVISRAVGVNDLIKIDVVTGKSKAGDLFLLCSDGLTDMVEDTSVSTVLEDERPLDGKPRALIDLAKSAGGKDNITVVIARIFE